MKPKSISVRILDPKKIRIYRNRYGDLVLSVNGIERRVSRVVRAFPITMPWRYIIFIDENGEEIGLLKSFKGLDNGSAKVLREELEKRYFIPKITKIHEIREEFGVLVWKTETDKGPRTFEVTSRRNIKRISGGRILVRDGDDNLYEIDYRCLDRRSRTLIDETF